MPKRKRFDLRHQLLIDTENLHLQVERLRAFLKKQQLNEENEPAASLNQDERRLLQLNERILTFIDEQLRKSEKTLNHLQEKGFDLTPMSKALAFISNCMESLVRFITQWRVTANSDNGFLNQFQSSVGNHLEEDGLAELSYLLAFASHAGNMNLSQPISIQLSMLETMEMVYQPLPNHIQLMVASQDWDTNTNPFSMLKVAHDVMALMAGSTLLRGADSPNFVLAPHCKSTVGRGPMMCHAVMFAMMLDPTFEKYRSVFYQKLAFLLGPKPINRQRYMAAIADSASQIPNNNSEKENYVLAFPSGAAKDTDLIQDLLSLADLLAERVPTPMAYRVQEKRAKGPFLRTKQVLATRYGHLRNAPKGAQNKYSFATYRLAELRESLSNDQLTHQAISDYLTSKRRMGYFKGGREGKLMLLKMLDVFFRENDSSLIHRGMTFNDTELTHALNQLLSIALNYSSDAFLQDSTLTTTGWYSKRRKDYEEQLSQNHGTPGSSMNRPVRRVRRMQGLNSDDDARSGRQGVEPDYQTRELANTDLADMTLQEEDKFKQWKEALKQQLPSLKDASSLIKHLVKETKRDMPLKELQRHIKRYLNFAMNALDRKERSLDEKEKIPKQEEYLGRGAVRREHMNHMSKVLAMWLRQMAAGECSFPDLSDEALNEHLMMLPSRSKRLFSSRKTSKAVAKLPESILSAIKDLLSERNSNQNVERPPIRFTFRDQRQAKELPNMNSLNTAVGVRSLATHMHDKQHTRIELGPLKLELLSHKDLYEYRDISAFKRDESAVLAANHALNLRWQSGKLPEKFDFHQVVSLGHLGFLKEAQYFHELSRSIPEENPVASNQQSAPTL